MSIDVRCRGYEIHTLNKRFNTELYAMNLRIFHTNRTIFSISMSCDARESLKRRYKLVKRQKRKNIFFAICFIHWTQKRFNAEINYFSYQNDLFNIYVFRCTRELEAKNVQTCFSRFASYIEHQKRFNTESYAMKLIIFHTNRTIFSTSMFCDARGSLKRRYKLVNMPKT